MALRSVAVHLGGLTDAAFAEIHTALLEHQVIFFREQGLTWDQHKAFGRRFGALHIHPFLQPLKDEGHPEFVVLESDAKHPFVAEAWHKDMKPAESAALLGFLYRHIECPDFSCRFRWRPNSMAVWDNRCTQHRVAADNLAAYRPA